MLLSHSWWLGPQDPTASLRKSTRLVMSQMWWMSLAHGSTTCMSRCPCWSCWVFGFNARLHFSVDIARGSCFQFQSLSREAKEYSCTDQYYKCDLLNLIPWTSSLFSLTKRICGLCILSNECLEKDPQSSLSRSKQCLFWHFQGVKRLMIVDEACFFSSCLVCLASLVVLLCLVLSQRSCLPGFLHPVTEWLVVYPFVATCLHMCGSQGTPPNHPILLISNKPSNFRGPLL